MCLTQGLTLDCTSKSNAGLQQTIYLAPKEDFEDAPFTVDPDGKFSAAAFTVASGRTGFEEIEIQLDTGGFTEEVGGTAPNLFFTQTLTFTIPKLCQETRNVLEEWLSCNCGLVAIFVDNNCKQWVMGVSYDGVCSDFNCRGVRVAAGTSGVTGVDPTADFNQYTITLTATSFEFSREYAGAIPTA